MLKSQKDEEEFTPANAYSPPVKQPRARNIGSDKSSERNDHELSFEKMPSIFNLKKVEDTIRGEVTSVFDDNSEEYA